MDSKDLRDQLNELAEAIDSMQASDSEKEKLQLLIDSVEARLGDDREADDEQLPVTETVDELISSFEADHPTIAGILNNIMVTLSSMGI